VSLTGGTTFGANATLSCNTGYNLVGSSMVSCEVGGWNSNSSCKAVGKLYSAQVEEYIFDTGRTYFLTKSAITVFSVVFVLLNI